MRTLPDIAHGVTLVVLNRLYLAEPEKSPWDKHEELVQMGEETARVYVKVYMAIRDTLKEQQAALDVSQLY
jgi:hypothetical protein